MLFASRRSQSSPEYTWILFRNVVITLESNFAWTHIFMDNFHGMGAAVYCEWRRGKGRGVRKTISTFYSKSFWEFYSSGPYGSHFSFPHFDTRSFCFPVHLIWTFQDECRVIVIMFWKLIVIRLQSPEAFHESASIYVMVLESHFSSIHFW